jgi:hypothetical protein
LEAIPESGRQLAFPHHWTQMNEKETDPPSVALGIFTPVSMPKDLSVVTVITMLTVGLWKDSAP